MATRYVIGPSIGVARLGNSPDEFYLEPEEIGGRPIACDAEGNAQQDGGGPAFVARFKDAQGRVKRQAARFRVYRIDDANETEVTLQDPSVASISWTVHLANKKGAWYQFAELKGNLLLGPKNSYGEQSVDRRNEGVKGTAKRRKLIIDPGPRTVTGPNQKVNFDKASVPAGYKFASFPPKPKLGAWVRTLGEMRTDSAGRLIVLGGFGESGGDQTIEDFGGQDTWHDDTSDGPISCLLKLTSGETIELNAWCLVGSPKFAPEIVNISTLDDTMYDVAVRHLAAAPDLYANGRFNDAFVANFDRDIVPILDRPGGYRWVANVPSMSSAASARSNPRDNTAAAAAFRQAYFALLREPGPEDKIAPSHNVLLSPTGVPMMPLNSGSNSVSNHRPDKFMALTETQHFFLRQWANGSFDTKPAPLDPAHVRLSRASTGNCVGNPFCPGIEVTWTTRNPSIYDAPWSIRHRKPSAWYLENGLDPDRDETETKEGCEPGDLSKRMANPWQADFFQCSVQDINFTDPGKNTGADEIPKPPTYYAYWWPPQSPWQVLMGELTPAAQARAGKGAGEQVLYTRGINCFRR